MPNENEPGSPTAPSVEDKLAELEALRESVEADRLALSQQREQTEALNNTMNNLATAIANSNRPAEPDDEPLPEDYDEATLRASAQITKRAMKAFYDELAPTIRSLTDGNFEAEWERVRQSDPKNFDRMSNQMRQYFDKNPDARRGGAVNDLFVRMRGTHFRKLQEMDAAERQQLDPTPDPNPLRTPKPKAGEESAVLNVDELRIVRGMRGAVHPEDYYLGRYGKKPNFSPGYLESIGFQPKGDE